MSFREQAGAQEKRGCLEHLVSLRLLCDTVKRKKFKIFVTFIDFSQAYDRVARIMLFRVLLRLGCGTVMLCALAAMYCVTESWVGTTLVLVFFVNDLNCVIKERMWVRWLFTVATRLGPYGQYSTISNYRTRHAK